MINQPGVVNFIVLFLASFLIWFLLVGLFVVWFSDGKIKKEQVLHALFAFALSWVIAEIIKTLFPTMRPFQIDGRLPLTLTFSSDGAFPSGHTAAAFGLAVTIWLHDKKIGILFLIGAITVGVARVLANVHYPIDILGGALVGIVVAIVIEKFHFKLRA